MCVLLVAIGTVAVLEDVIGQVATTSDAVIIVASALDVVNVKDAPNSSPKVKLEESDLEDVDDIEVLLAAYQLVLWGGEEEAHCDLDWTTSL